MLMEDELESLEDMKILKKLGTIRLPPMTKVFTDQRQNLIIQNDLSITLNSKPTCPASTSSFKILNCLKCQGKVYKINISLTTENNEMHRNPFHNHRECFTKIATVLRLSIST